VFEDLDQVREISAEWLQVYNEERPHKSLGSVPEARFRATVESKTTSPSESRSSTDMDQIVVPVCVHLRRIALRILAFEIPWVVTSDRLVT